MEYWRQLMDIVDIFAEIKRRPGFYIDGDKSLKRVRSYLVGYQVGSTSTANEPTDEVEFHHFHDWVAKRLGFGESTSGWCNMILERAGSDEKAYDMFFKLLDEFKESGGSNSAKPEA